MFNIFMVVLGRTRCWRPLVAWEAVKHVPFLSLDDVCWLWRRHSSKSTSGSGSRKDPAGIGFLPVKELFFSSRSTQTGGGMGGGKQTEQWHVCLVNLWLRTWETRSQRAAKAQRRPLGGRLICCQNPKRRLFQTDVTSRPSRPAGGRTT